MFVPSTKLSITAAVNSSGDVVAAPIAAVTAGSQTDILSFLWDLSTARDVTTSTSHHIFTSRSELTLRDATIADASSLCRIVHRPERPTATAAAEYSDYYPPAESMTCTTLNFETVSNPSTSSDSSLEVTNRGIGYLSECDDLTNQLFAEEDRLPGHLQLPPVDEFSPSTFWQEKQQGHRPGEAVAVQATHAKQFTCMTASAASAVNMPNQNDDSSKNNFRRRSSTSGAFNTYHSWYYPQKFVSSHHPECSLVSDAFYQSASDSNGAEGMVAQK